MGSGVIIGIGVERGIGVTIGIGVTTSGWGEVPGAGTCALATFVAPAIAPHSSAVPNKRLTIGMFRMQTVFPKPGRAKIGGGSLD
jgi:hypothetical protein